MNRLQLNSLTVPAAAVLLFLLKMCSYSLYVRRHISHLSDVKYVNLFLLLVAMMNLSIGAPLTNLT